MGDRGTAEKRKDRPALLRRLLDHMLWADERVGRALRAADAPPRAAVEIYAHLIATEQVWLARIRGTEPGPVWPDVDDPAAPALEEIRATVKNMYMSYLQGVTIDDLDHVVRYVNSAGDGFETSAEDILIHVFLHGAYHRGQISTLLRESGEEPSPTDYVAFVRGSPAATRRDGRSHA